MNSSSLLMMRNLKTVTWSVSAIIGLSTAVAWAELGDASKLPPASTKTGLTYDNDIKPLLQKSCVKCHGPEKPKSKYRVDSREALIKGGKSDEAAVVPGESTKSPIAHYVSDLVTDMEMPPLEKREKYPPLTKEQIGILRAWIDQGAK
jgi:Planctomycete cytochrome C